MKKTNNAKGVAFPYYMEEDRQMFHNMKNKYISYEEKEFFEKMEKLLSEYSDPSDYLIHENENDDKIYWLKDYRYEHRIGRVAIIDGREVLIEAHFDSLYDLLHCNMKEEIDYHTDITFWQWLRNNKYKNIHYERSWED